MLDYELHVRPRWKSHRERDDESLAGDSEELVSSRRDTRAIFSVDNVEQLAVFVGDRCRCHCGSIFAALTICPHCAVSRFMRSAICAALIV